jgi:hypothetical protein
VDFRLANVIRDEIPAPREYIQLDYKGPNPMAVYHRMDQLLKTIWEVKGTNMFEPDFRWDMTADPRPFFIHLFVDKGMDKLTNFRVDIKMQGSQPTDPTKDGVLRIEIHGWIETKFDGFLGNPINKILFPLFFFPYMVGYYQPRRRRYLEWHKRRIDRLVDEIRTTLKIPSVPIP